MDSPWDRAIRGEDVSRPRGLSDVETSVDSNGTVKFSLGAPDTPADKLVMTKSKKKSSYAGEWVEIDEAGGGGTRSSGGRSRKKNSSNNASSIARSDSASEGHSRRGGGGSGSGAGGRDRSLSWECNYLEDSPKESVGSAADGGTSAAKEGGLGGLPGSSRKNTPKESPRTQGRKKRSALKSIFSRALSVEKPPTGPKDNQAAVAGTKKKQLSAQEAQSKNPKRHRHSNASAASKQDARTPEASSKGKKASAIASIASAFTLTPTASGTGNAIAASFQKPENDVKAAGSVDDVSAAIRSWSSAGADDSDDPEEMEEMDSEPENEEGTTLIVRDTGAESTQNQRRPGKTNTKAQAQQANRAANRGKAASKNAARSDVDGAPRTKKPKKTKSSSAQSAASETSAKPPVVHHTKKEKLTAMEKKARKKAKRTAKVVRRALLMLQAVAGVLDPELAAAKARKAPTTEATDSQSGVSKKHNSSAPKAANADLSGAGERTILSLDVEAYEHNHDRLLEVGCTRYTFHVDEVRRRGPNLEMPRRSLAITLAM